VAVRRAVINAAGLPRECGLKIKWTNDLVLNGKKLCGLLAESACSGVGNCYAVVGAGLNVNQDKEDFSEALRDKATSLFLETGLKRDCRPIAEAIAGGILKAYGELEISARPTWTNTGKTASP
jgi:BirA family biotin operon repressor/biotin-[acetyl-CoA-carboxylase] ligase